VLGDIPLLGTLFSVEHTNQEKRDLYIVVTPHIVTADAAAGPPPAAAAAKELPPSPPSSS
jgi:type II secretory pathway component GspD/PulD (secretin)